MKVKPVTGRIIGTVIPARIEEWQNLFVWGSFRCRSVEGKWVVEEDVGNWKPIIICDTAEEAIRKASETVRARGY